MQWKKIITILAVLILFAAAAGVIKTQFDKIPGQKLLGIMSKKVDIQVHNVHYTETNAQGTKWEVRAETARYVRSENRAFFNRVTIKMVMQNGKEFELNADRGEMNTDTKDINVSGNVVVVSNAGDRFRTERLNYSDTLKRFQTDLPVSMENRQTTITGVGMWLSLKDEDAGILSGVKAVIR